ncbi:hypothetical protein [Magnetospirillum sulfuroxidans]|uniref:ATP-binding protein n=1 Tax=Magnetospirillum sulfuroxidans TaxID=611300 RepID=A0ABS5ICI8_9PROT|nr:hypothetical protein [Magnetospirillum sulfuroxidans]MBR9972105.1 hypothetical protein [Magnetospirillum sulfuroxidans]
MRKSHIDLDRRFLDCQLDAGSEEVALDSYVTHANGNLTWDDLIAHGRVVLLGEAGSGKTWEMEAQAERLVRAGKHAFFVRIDALGEGGLEGALAPKDRNRYADWQPRLGHGIFLLDAKDEAQLIDHHAFERALRKFTHHIGDYQHHISSINKSANIRKSKLLHSSIVLSCRVSEWQPLSDLQMVLHLLGPSPFSNSDDEKRAPLRIVQIAPLDNERVHRFASRRMDNPSAFLNAVNQAHAWEFARRPRDVENLIGYWEEHKRLGSLSELLEFDVNRKLTDINRQWIKLVPLELSRAREGAEALAACVTFTRRFTFAIPDEETRSPPDALDSQAALPDWTDKDRQALLSRAMFDEATYGRIRFHHRGSVDYLSARWLLRLVDDYNCPRAEILRLLFPTSSSSTVVPTSLAPVAGWLAGWIKEVRTRLLEVDPDILIRFGDPSLLPPPVRIQLLQRIAETNRLRNTEDREQLGRLADPTLAPTINRLLRGADVAPDVKLMLLILVQQGRLRDCGRMCLMIAADSHQPWHLRHDAIAALHAMDDRRRLAALAIQLTNGPTIPSTLASTIVKFLYPNTMSEDDVGNLLARTDVEGSGGRRMAHACEDVVTSVAEDRLPALTDMLFSLTFSAPWVDEGRGQSLNRISRAFGWTARPLLAAIYRLLGTHDLVERPPEYVAELVDRLKNFQGDIRGEGKDLQAALEPHPTVIQALTDRQIAALREKGPDDRIRTFAISGYHCGLWHLANRDIPWLLQRATTTLEPADRRLALRLAIELWQQHGRRLAVRARIMSVAIARPILWRTYWSCMDNPLVRLKQQAERWRQRWREDRPSFYVLRHRLQTARIRATIAWHCVTSFRRLMRGEDWATLYNLLHFSEDESRTIHQWEDQTLEPMAKTFGRMIRAIARRGFKNHWRRWQPPPPELNTGYKPAEVSLLGLKLDVDDGLDLAALSPEHAEIAARLALHELNGLPSWLPTLIAHHPQTARTIFARQIGAEFQVPAEVQHVSELISALLWEDDGAARALCGPGLLAALSNAEPAHPKVLADAVATLYRDGDTAALAALAAHYGPTHSFGQPQFLTWLVMWFLTDAKPALAFLEATLAAHPGQADDLVVALAAAFLDRMEGPPDTHRPSIHAPSVLRPFVTRLNRHVRYGDDINRSDGKAYSPTARDRAQQLRDSLFNLLIDKATSEELRDLAANPVFVCQRDRLLHLANERAKREAERNWTVRDVADFAQRFTKPPTTADELFDIVCWRLEDIVEDAENGDFSLRGTFGSYDHERVLQVWLARQLELTSRKFYTVERESEVLFADRPDLRLRYPGLDPVTLEVKWAHKEHWSYSTLLEALETQLIGQYMRSNRSRYGIYFLATVNATRLWIPPGEPHLDFPALCLRLQQEAKRLLEARGRGERITVVGLDLS